MNKQRTIIASLALLCIILGSILMANFQEQRAGKLPYTIGSPVASLDPMMTGMMLKPFIVSADEPVPTVDFTIARDSMGDGWTLHATTTNFQFTPEHLNMAPAPGEGHLHLYIDNDLIVMLSPWQHIDALSP